MTETGENGRILLTGGSGQLGTELRRRDWPAGWTIDAPSRAALDLADADALRERVLDGDYAAVINAGAYTAVDAAESDAAAAWRINAVAPAALAAGCREAGIPVIQVSTDYVFDGSQDGAWRPDDRLAPLGVYGASKAGGELALRGSGARHAVLRTAWVVSAHGRNFVKTMLRLGAERDELSVVADQCGSPTAAPDLAQAVAAVASAFITDPVRRSGVWHVANLGRASWHELAQRVFERASMHGRPAPQVVPVATADFPTAARRPANSQLDTATLAADFGIHLPPWGESIDRIVDELCQKEAP